jgi:hypothetical protein
MHLPLMSVAAIVAEAILFSGCSAFRTPAGLVLESFAGEELLLTCAKGESHAAIRASQGLVRVLHR